MKNIIKNFKMNNYRIAIEYTITFSIFIQWQKTYINSLNRICTFSLIFLDETVRLVFEDFNTANIHRKYCLVVNMALNSFVVS